MNHTEANLGLLNDEIINHVLTYLSYEEIDKLRLVDKKLKAVCDHRLKEAYLKVKQEIELWCEKLFCLTNGQLVSYDSIGLCDFVRKMFWFFVREFLKNSFCLFDILMGYLDVEYSVNGKTIDLVQQILWLKDSDDPLSLLVELVIGRNVNHSNMKSYDDFECAYSQWFKAKKYRGVEIHSLYVPLLKKSDAELMCTHIYDNSTNEFSAVMLDILSTLWTEKAHLNAHLLWDSTRVKYCEAFPTKLIPVLKPGEDKDPQLYRELLEGVDSDGVEYYPEDEEYYPEDEEYYPEDEEYYPEEEELDIKYREWELAYSRYKLL